MFGELTCCSGLRGGAWKRVDRVSPGRPQSFRYERRPPVDDCSPRRGGMAQEAERFFMAKWIAARRESQGWTTRHLVVVLIVCPNVARRTQKRIVQKSKRARRVGTLANVEKPQNWCELVPSGFFVCRCHIAFLWRFVVIISLFSFFFFLLIALFCFVFSCLRFY